MVLAQLFPVSMHQTTFQVGHVASEGSSYSHQTHNFKIRSFSGKLYFFSLTYSERRGDEPFFTLGLTVHDWGWPKNGPFWTKNCQTWQACQRSKVVQRGPKGTKMVNLSLFEHLGPFWAHLDPFGPFQTRIDILLRSAFV